MDTFIPALDRANGHSLYRQLLDALEAGIAGGELHPGDRLPSERDLAARLGVSRTTVVHAYHELEARGLVRGHVGRGTFVCALPAEDGAPFAWRGKVALSAQRTLDPAMRVMARAAADPEVISLASASGAIDLFPVDAYQDTSARILSRGPEAVLTLAPTEGHRRLRTALAARLRVQPEQVLVVSGAQQGLDLIARCLLDPGDAVIMDRPGYLGAIQLFRAAGARIIGWDVARWDLEELEDLVLRFRPKLLYVNPTYQNPTGRTMPGGLRHGLLDLAARYHLPVIEDEPSRELWFSTPPPASMRELDDRRLVIYSGTFSKTLATGLRVGWLAASEAIVDQLSLIKQRSDVSSPSLNQLIIADMLANGVYDRHLANVRAEHARRHDAALRAIEQHIPAGLLHTTPVEGGLCLWCRLDNAIDGQELALAAAREGVAVMAGEAFYPDASEGTGAGRHELRLSFGGIRPSAIDEGVRRLAAVLQSGRLRTAGQPRAIK